jgi:ABC transporter
LGKKSLWKMVLFI